MTRLCVALILLAQELRLDRISARRPGDPSHRERVPHVTFTCPCGAEFRQPWQRRLHATLKVCAQ